MPLGHPVGINPAAFPGGWFFLVMAVKKLNLVSLLKLHTRVTTLRDQELQLDFAIAEPLFTEQVIADAPHFGKRRNNTSARHGG